MTKRTDRTPENRQGTAKFLRLITIVSLFTAIVCIHLLNVHQESTIDLVMRNQASLSTHQNHGLRDIVSRIEDSVAGMQSIFFFSFILHSVVHFLTHRLDVVERGVPRIVDLQAAKSVPKTE